MTKQLLLTLGEPAGIGPDIFIQWLQKNNATNLTVVADPDLLRQRAEQLRLPIDLNQINMLPVKLKAEVIPQKLNPANAEYVLETLKIAATLCLEKKAAGLVTGPVHKGVINQAGFAFTGHTHYLADLAGVSDVVMMLMADKLRVVLVTDHVPLKKVSEMITEKQLQKTFSIVHESLQKQFKIKNPRIKICGLNPHAGENGYLGDEEQKVIIPVIQQYQKQGWDIEGPLPADTAFLPEKLAHSDVVIAMYHDQGLTIIKHLAFDRAVNITLGLPFVRTSVDHGTALELAATGKSDYGSLAQAIQLAGSMTNAFCT